MDASFGNRCRITATSSSFVPLKAFVLACGYYLSAGGGEIGTVSNVAWFITLVLGSDVQGVFFFGLLMVLYCLMLFFLFVNLCCYGVVIG